MQKLWIIMDVYSVVITSWTRIGIRMSCNGHRSVVETQLRNVSSWIE